MVLLVRGRRACRRRLPSNIRLLKVGKSARQRRIWSRRNCTTFSPNTGKASTTHRLAVDCTQGASGSSLIGDKKITVSQLVELANKDDKPIQLKTDKEITVLFPTSHSI